MVNQVFAGKSNVALAKSIADLFKVDLALTMISKFSDGEISVEVKKVNPCSTVFILQSLHPNTSEYLVELLLLADAVKRSMVYTEIVCIIPYCSYTRQDRVISRFLDADTEILSPLSAKVIADVIQTVGMKKIITIDLHSRQLEGFFNIPIVNIDPTSLFVDFALCNREKKISIIAPDFGSLSRARFFSNQLVEKGCLDVDVVVIDKLRTKPGTSKVMNVLGDVRNRHCIIIDDIIDSGGTIYSAASVLRVQGASRVDAYVTHAVLSGSAITNLVNSSLDRLIVTDTIDHGEKLDNISKIEIISVAELIYKNL